MRKKTESTITVQCLLIIYSTGKEVKQTKKLKTELKELAYLGWKITRSWKHGLSQRPVDPSFGRAFVNLAVDVKTLVFCP
jgi:hypothetical protein